MTFSTPSIFNCSIDFGLIDLEMVVSLINTKGVLDICHSVHYINYYFLLKNKTITYFVKKNP